MGQSKYHLGFTSLERETSVNQLPVRGHVPTWLTGTLVRAGPAKFEVGSNTYNHWFDGLAMLHAFSFSSGVARHDLDQLTGGGRDATAHDQDHPVRGTGLLGSSDSQGAVIPRSWGHSRYLRRV